MLREILTLVVDGKPTQYYIKFARERRRFSFQPTLKNKSFPSFVVFIKEGDFVIEPVINEYLSGQAIEKVKEIIANPLFEFF
jgi:hypothetical protein